MPPSPPVPVIPIKDFIQISSQENCEIVPRYKGFFRRRVVGLASVPVTAEDPYQPGLRLEQSRRGNEALKLFVQAIKKEKGNYYGTLAVNRLAAPLQKPSPFHTEIVKPLLESLEKEKARVSEQNPRILDQFLDLWMEVDKLDQKGWQDWRGGLHIFQAWSDASLELNIPPDRIRDQNWRELTRRVRERATQLAGPLDNQILRDLAWEESLVLLKEIQKDNRELAESYLNCWEIMIGEDTKSPDGPTLKQDLGNAAKNLGLDKSFVCYSLLISIQNAVRQEVLLRNDRLKMEEIRDIAGKTIKTFLDQLQKKLSLPPDQSNPDLVLPHSPETQDTPKDSVAPVLTKDKEKKLEPETDQMSEKMNILLGLLDTLPKDINNISVGQIDGLLFQLIEKDVLKETFPRKFLTPYKLYIDLVHPANAGVCS